MTNRSRVLVGLLTLAVPVAAAEFVSKEKGFRITFPGVAREMPAPVPLPPNAADLKQWLVDANTRAYVASVTDWQRIGPDDDAILDVLKDSTVAAYEKGQLKGERFIAIHGRPGREIDIDLPDGTRLTTQLFVDRAARRSMNITAVMTKNELGHPSVRAFLDSFAFLIPTEKTIYKAKDGTFGATFPGPVSEQSEPSAEGLRTGVTAVVDGRTFTVTRVDLTAALDGDPQQRLDNARDGALRRVRESKLASETRVTVSGRPGRDLRIDAAGDLTLFNRIVLDVKPRHFYSAMVISRRPRADTAVVTAFFDTVRLAEER